VYRNEAKRVFVVVAFRYDKKNSVMYVTEKSPDGVAQVVYTALSVHNADVISIRRVYEECLMK